MTELELPVLKPDRGRHRIFRTTAAFLGLILLTLLAELGLLVWLPSADSGMKRALLLNLGAFFLVMLGAAGLIAGRTWSGSRVQVTAEGFSYPRALRSRRFVPWSRILDVEFRRSTVIIRVRGWGRVMVPLGQYENPGALVDLLYEHVRWDRIEGEAPEALTIRGRSHSASLLEEP